MVGGDVDGADADAEFAGVGGEVDAGEVAEDAAAGLEVGEAGGEGAVIVGEAGEEALEVVLAQEVGVDQWVDVDLLELEGEAELAGEDEGLAGDVEAAEVVAGVGLGVAAAAGLADGLRERDAAHDLAGDEAEGAGEGALDAVDAVAGADEVGEGGDDGEGGADGGLVAPGRVGAAGGLVELGVGGGAEGEGFFVGADDVDAAGEGLGVDAGHAVGGGAVDEHGGGQATQALEQGGEGAEGVVAGEAGGLADARLPALEIEALGLEEGAAAVGDADDLEVDAVVLAQLGLLLVDLGEQLGADGAVAEDQEAELLVGEVEGGVDGAHGEGRLAAVDGAGDRSRAHALGDRSHGHADLAERPEELRGGGARVHALGDEGEEGDRGAHAGAVDVAAGPLERELGVDRRGGGGGGVLGDDDGDGLAVGGLVGHPHGDAGQLEGPQDAGADAGLVAELSPADVEEGELLQRGDAGGAGLRGAALVDAGAVGVGVHRAADPQDDLVLDERDHGPRVEHAGAEVGELERLLIRHAGDRVGVAQDRGVAGHDAGDVGPDLDLAGREGAGEEGGGVVGAVAAEGGAAAVGGGAEEAGVDGDRVAPGGAQGVQAGLAGGVVDEGGAEAVVGDEPVAGVDEDGGLAGDGEQGGEDAGAEALAEGEHEVEGLRGALAQEGDAGEHLAQRDQQGGDVDRDVGGVAGLGGVGVVGAAAQELGEGAEAGVDGEAGDAVDERVGGEGVAARGGLGGVDEPVGAVTHRRDDDGDGAEGGLAEDEVGDADQAVGGADRGAAELEDAEGGHGGKDRCEGTGCEGQV